MAVETGARGAENHHPIKQWRDPLAALCLVSIPQLKMSAPCLIPSVVEIEQQVESAVEFEAFVVVEICVDAKLSTAADFVHAATTKVRVDD